MPLLSPEYISNIQCIFNEASGKWMILESFDQRQMQSVMPIKFLQGSLKTGIVDIGHMTWNTKLVSPVFILDHSAPIECSFDILLAAMNDPRFVIFYDYDYGLTSIMKEATITIDQSGVKCDIDIISDNVLTPGLFTVGMENFLGALDVIGRVAKFYDTSLAMGGLTLPIISGVIRFQVDVKENCFMASSFPSPPLPYFSVNGYHISGQLRCAYDANVIGYQQLQTQESCLMTTDSQNLQLRVGSFWLSFPDASVVYKEVTKSMKAGELVAVEIFFESFATNALPNINPM